MQQDHRCCGLHDQRGRVKWRKLMNAACHSTPEPRNKHGKPGALHRAGYRQEPAIAPGSNVETFVALKFAIDNWRWAGVPFYLHTGKRLPNRATEIAIHFR